MSLSLEKCTLRFTVKRLLSADNTYIGYELVSHRVICCLSFNYSASKQSERKGRWLQACDSVANY